ncbi:MAG TPA: penicillin-binding protein 2, partial [Candidatus Marinimicrobia bacterium]|nr:penicillin-binding protein 2 [Candidatus Neomarinimicrobiota bacterium]
MLKAENLISKQRYYIIIGIVIFLMLILLSRFFYLQIFRYEKYKHKAEINRIRAVTVNAPRGLILDRNGNILVDNYPTYILTAIPGEMEQKEKIFNSISQCTGIDSLIIAENFKKYYRAKFVPTRLMKDLTFHQISVLEENILDLPGVNYKQFPERYYPSSINGSHFLGYLKEVDKPVQGNLGNPNVYELGDLIGWSGLEKFYESQLKGTRGVKYLEVDALGREMEEVKGYNNQRPEPGADIKLMIDSDLQLLMEEKMKDYRGIAVLSNPVTGGILAYVSKPDYPPNIFTGKMLKDDWNEVRNDPHRPLMDRIITGLYPPGSTFKIITALALLEENLLDPSKEVECTGSYQFGDRTFHCWNETGHGSV